MYKTVLQKKKKQKTKNKKKYKKKKEKKGRVREISILGSLINSSVTFWSVHSIVQVVRCGGK